MRGNKETGPIKIGFIGPLTGGVSSLGQNSKAAVEVALEEINSNGGIDGRLVEVIFEDGKCDGKAGADAASKLINIDKVSVILGGLCSSETSAFANIIETAKVPSLSYCSSAPTITSAGDYVFRNYPSDLFQGVVAADYVKNKLNKSKVAILYTKSDWGNGLADSFEKKFTEIGGTVVAKEGHEQTSRDLRTQLSKIKASNPDLIYFPGYTEQTITGLKQMSEMKISVPVFGGDNWDDPKIYKDSGLASEGIMFTAPKANSTEDFKAKMKVKVGSDDIVVCSPYAYDGLKILSQVIGKVGTDSTAIKDELYKTVFTGGISSKEISFDQNGDPKSATYSVKVVKNGKAEIVE
jgi:branched-chain amino acid transport system substrate-binding protein